MSCWKMDFSSFFPQKINISFDGEKMEITNAQHTQWNNEPCSIRATIDGEVCSVPLQPGNRHYDEIMRQVEAGTLTIADAE